MLGCEGWGDFTNIVSRFALCLVFHPWISLQSELTNPRSQFRCKLLLGRTQVTRELPSGHGVMILDLTITFTSSVILDLIITNTVIMFSGH